MGGCLRVSKNLYKSGAVKTDSASPPQRAKLSHELRGIHTHIASGRVLSGRGAACTCEPITRRRVYFEIRLRSQGAFAVGVTIRPEKPQRTLDREICDNKGSFGLKSDMLAAVPEPGDTIGVFIDSTSGSTKLSFSLNGLPLSDLYDAPRPMSGISIPDEPLFPVVYVNRGAMVEAMFQSQQWKYPPSEKSGFDEHISVVQELTMT